MPKWFVKSRPRGEVVYEGVTPTPTPTITLAPLTAVSLTVGTPFTRTFSASGGTAPYTYSLASGTLPAGLALAGANLSGTPTTAGAFSFGIRATDAAGFFSAVGTFSGTVADVVTPPSDTTPDAFTFNDVANATPSAAQTSNTITVSGINAPATMTVVGGVYYKNGGAASAVSTTVVAGDTVSVGHTASSSNGTAVNTVLTIGGVSDTFTSTTVAVATFPTTTDATLPVPTLTLATGQTTYPPQFDIGNLADGQVGDTLWIEQRDKAGALIARFSNTIDDAEATAEAASFGLSVITTGTYRYAAFLARGSVVSVGSAVVIHGPDDVEPTLSLPTKTGITATNATVGAFTSEGNGTLYAVLTSANTAPSALQVENGQNAAGAAAAKAGNVTVTSTGAKTIALTGLTAATTYYLWLMHKDAAGNRSAVLAGGSVVTSAASVQTLLWSTTDKNADVTRSSDGKTATIGTGGIKGIRSAIALDLTKKLYIEVPLVFTPGSSSLTIAIANATASLSGFMGSDANSAGVLFQGTSAEYFQNNVRNGGATGSATASPSVLCLAINGPAKTYAARLGGGNWYAGGQNADPDLADPRSFSALTGTLYLGFSSDQSGDNATIRSIAGDMQHPIPTGYVTVDA